MKERIPTLPPPVMCLLIRWTSFPSSGMTAPKLSVKIEQDDLQKSYTATTSTKQTTDKC